MTGFTALERMERMLKVVNYVIKKWT